ncbi:MAG: DUF2750 domain-containing protein [Terrimicrobiaceae bacterium]
MLPDQATPQENYELFIRQVVETGVVWGLESASLGWAHSVSEESEETDVILFWSDREEAASHQKEDWTAHTPVAIEFDDFIDGWLQGMDSDGVMAGPNWDAQLTGLEISARELADALLIEKEGE